MKLYVQLTRGVVVIVWGGLRLCGQGRAGGAALTRVRGAGAGVGPDGPLPIALHAYLRAVSQAPVPAVACETSHSNVVEYKFNCSPRDTCYIA